MPTIRKFRAEDTTSIVLRESDLESLEGIDLVEHGKQLAQTPEAVTVLADDGQIIVCVGGFVCGKTCWVFLLTSPLIESYPLLTVKVVRKLIRHGVGLGVARFETLVNPNDARAVRFIEHVGFEREGLCRATGDNLMDRYLYARICLAGEK